MTAGGDLLQRAEMTRASDPWCPDCGLPLQVEQPQHDRIHPPESGPGGIMRYPVLVRCPRNAERPVVPIEPPFVGGAVSFHIACDYARVLGHAPMQGGLEVTGVPDGYR
jgi:hypothetical protein